MTGYCDAMLFKILSICKGGGYRYCRTDPPHPRRNSNDLYPLHIVLMENHLGRLMVPGEQVHHANEDKTDDRIENLEVKTASEHARHHKLKDAPPPVRVECAACNLEFFLKPHQARLRSARNRSGKLFCSRSCGATWTHRFSSGKEEICGVEERLSSPLS